MNKRHQNDAISRSILSILLSAATLSRGELAVADDDTTARVEVEPSEPVRPNATAVAVGVAFFGVLPAVDLRYTRPLGDRSLLEAALATGGVVQHARAGTRYRLTPDDSEVAVSLRFSTIELHAVESDVSFVSVGFGPGLVLEILEDDFIWTFALDAAWSALEDGDAMRGDASVLELDPSFAVALPISRTVRLWIEARALIVISAESFAIPLLGAGVAW